MSYKKKHKRVRNTGSEDKTHIFPNEVAFKESIERAPIGIYLTDKEGKYTYANREWLKMTGLNLEQALGAGWKKGLHPEDREKIFRSWNQAAQKGILWDKEYRFKNTEKITWVRGLAVKRIDENGSMIGYLGVNINITEKIEAQKSEQAAQKSFDLIAENLAQVIYLYDPQTDRFQYVSPAFEKIWEEPVASVYDEPFSFTNKIHPEDLPFFREAIKKEQKEGIILDIEYRIQPHKGKIKWVHSFNNPILDENGDHILTVGIAEDITARKIAEQKIAQSEQQYQSVVEDSPVLIDRFLPDGTITFANTAYCKFCIGKESGMIGRNIFEKYNQIEKEAMKKYFAAFTPQNAVNKTETQLKRFDGQLRWVRWTDRALFDRDGQLAAIQAFGADITEQKELEKAFRDRERAISALMANLPGIAYRADTTGRLKMRFISQGCQALTGYLPEELVDNPERSYDDIVHPDNREHVINRIRDAIASKGSFECNYCIKTKTGEEKWVWEKGETIVDENGNPLYIEGFITDITDRIRAENAVKESEIRFRELFANMTDGAIVYQAINNGKDFLIKDINKSAQIISNIDREEVIGKRVTEAYPGVIPMGLLDLFKKVWKTGKPGFLPTAQYADKRISLWAENYVYKLPSGEVVAVFKDITKRKQAQMKMAESEARFRAFMDNFPANAYIKDENLRHVFVNKAAVDFAGIPLDKYIGKATGEIYPADIAAELDELDHSVLDDQIIIEREGFYQSKSGQRRYQRDIKFPIQGLHGEKLVGGIALDLTKQKKIEEKILQKAQFEQLLAQLSSDFLEMEIDQIDMGINHALDRVGKMLNLEHISVGYINHENCMILTHQWSEKQAQVMAQNYSLEEYPWLFAPFTSGGLRKWSVKDRLPTSLTEKEKIFIQNSNFQSSLRIPIHFSGMREGGITFSDSNEPEKFTPDLVESLRLFAQIIGNAIVHKNIQSELIKSEQRYRAVVEGSPVLICRYTSEGEILFANQAYCDYFGVPIDKIIGKKILEFSPSEIRDEINNRLKGLSRKKPLYRAESNVIDAKGENRWVRWTVHALFSLDGDVESIQSFGIDITEEHLASDRIAASESRYRSLFTEMASGFALFEVIYDKNHQPVNIRFLEVNPAFERLTGLNRDEVIGMAITEVLPDFDRDWIEDYIDIAIHEKSFIRKEYNHRLGIHTEIRAFSPQIGQCALLMTDITEQESLFTQIEQERDKIQQYLNVAGVIMLVLDREGKISLINQKGSEILGLAQEGILGKNWFETFIPKIERRKIKNIFNQVMSGALDQFEYVENQILTHFGELRDIAWRNTSLFDEEKNIIGTLSSGEDITERKAAQNQVRTLLDISAKLITESYDENILQDVADTIYQNIQKAHAVTIWLYDQYKKKLTVHAMKGFETNNIIGLTVDESNGIVGQVASRRKAVILNHTQKDGVFTDIGGFVPEMDKIQSLICAPLLIRGKLLGIVCIDNFESPEAFDDNDLSLLESIANQLAGVVENAILFEQLQHSQEELRALSNRLLQVHEEERRAIALDLHDHFGQILTTFKLSLRPELFIKHSEEDQRARLAEVTGIVDELIAAAEDLSLRLRPAILDDLGLAIAFEWHTKRISQQAKIPIYTNIQLETGLRLHEAIEITLYRVLEESIANAIKHGNPSKIEVTLEAENYILLKVHDDGSGFDFDNIDLSDYAHSGLTGMQERVRLINGHLTISSALGKGTTIQVTVPKEKAILHKKEKK